ncbi:tripeptidyl aminopeptidase [Streptomyces sulfonofaciens]|uniref:Tripeptidyl aminopeptidase n=1 Tax=Streptomyces sulfonofaciens TaxID=68272 RepID=A0A919GM06_9ACTN|nr:alpha/beta fold hydrolase [Streptomyces sulfonofaciens]GHH87008.1 tripeptidyl aminopeptidase [Streptomyces sulfonofaciens]
MPLTGTAHRRTRKAVVAAAGMALAALGVQSLAATTADAGQNPAAVPAAAKLVWKPCFEIARDWSTPEDHETECTTVPVPLDYAKPNGRQVDIAVSRIRATEPAHRRGVLLINPGGPGVPGVGEPYLLSRSKMADVGRDHDLIGFDTRGLGYSGKLVCPELSPDAAEQPPAGLTPKERARFRSDDYAENLTHCAERDPDFARSMTTANIARDMDRIRAALGEKKISYFGKSWGTALGASYRSLFGGHVDRMLLDSVLAPGQSKTDADDQLAAHEALFHDFAAWIAGYDGTYHFGRTGEEVAKALIALRDQLAAHPRPGGTGGPAVDGEAVDALLQASRADWARSAGDLVAIRDGGVPEAPSAAPSEAGGSEAAEPVGNGYADDPAPDGEADFMLASVGCNDSPADRDFEASWAHAEELRQEYPVAAYGSNATPGIIRCQGWPFPAQPWRLSRNGGALQLVGHAFEVNTPLPWAKQMQATIGGSLLTVQDDVHVSLENLPCASKAVAFFTDGTTSDGSCPGAPIPAPRTP